MLIKEYRIPLPLTVEEYRIAQLYMIQVCHSITQHLLRRLLRNIPFPHWYYYCFWPQAFIALNILQTMKVGKRV